MKNSLSTSPDYKFVDIHAHIMPLDMLKPAARAAMEATQPDLERFEALSTDPQRLIAYLDENNIQWLGMINYLSPDIIGYTEEANEYTANFAKQYPDRLIPFGGVDPRRTDDVAAYMDYLLGELGLKAMKLHPPHQLFDVNDYLFKKELEGLTTVYEKCVEYKAPLMVHTGTSVFEGARNRFADPLPIDDVAVDFPDLKIIDAHCGRPLYMDRSLFLLRRHPNVFCDISSTPPKRLLHYYPWLERMADKVMFGTDWPGPGVRRTSARISGNFLSLSCPMK